MASWLSFKPHLKNALFIEGLGSPQKPWLLSNHLMLAVLPIGGRFRFGARVRLALSTNPFIDTGMPLKDALKSDASSLPALSVEVWLGTYIRRGANANFADYALAEFTANRFETLLADPRQHIVVSENNDGIDGFIRVSRGNPAPVPVAECSGTEISTLYVQPRRGGVSMAGDQQRKHAGNWVLPGLWL